MSSVLKELPNMLDVFRTRIMRPDIALGVITAVMSLLGFVISLWQPQKIAKGIYAGIFVLLGAASLHFVVEQSNESQALQNRLENSSKQTFSYATGGDTYPFVHAHVITDGGKQQIGFYLQKNGQYPLYALRTFVSRPYKKKATDNVIYYFPGSLYREVQEFDENATYPIGFEPVPKDQSTLYSVSMYARNGHWEEVVDIEKTGSAYTTRVVIFGSDDPRVTPNKVIFDVADADFPAENRKRKVYPLNDVDLPIASP